MSIPIFSFPWAETILYIALLGTLLNDLDCVLIPVHFGRTFFSLIYLVIISPSFKHV